MCTTGKPSASPKAASATGHLIGIPQRTPPSFRNSQGPRDTANHPSASTGATAAKTPRPSGGRRRDRLAAAEVAWIVTVWPDDRPYATPKVPLSWDGRIWFRTGTAEVKYVVVGREGDWFAHRHVRARATRPQELAPGARKPSLVASCAFVNRTYPICRWARRTRMRKRSLRFWVTRYPSARLGCVFRM